MIKLTQDDLTQWFDFCEKLDLIDSFSFDRVTLRKEKRRGGLYWYAYKRINGKLINYYCGDKWHLREKLPHLANELAKKARGEVTPILSSSKPHAPFDPFEWFKRHGF